MAREREEIASAVESDDFRQLQANVADVELLGGEATCLSAGDEARAGNAAAVPDSATFRLMRSVGVQKLCIEVGGSVDYVWQSDWEDQRGVYHFAPSDSLTLLGDHSEDWGGGLVYYSTL